MKIHPGNSLALTLAALVFGSFSIQPVQCAFWITNSPMATARYWHTATLLSNGKVLAAGGYDNSGNSLSSAESYDPAAGKWILTGEMNDARSAHTATLLPNGQILVAGGLVFNNSSFYGVLATAEVYNPATGTWTRTGSMAGARVGQTATLLPDGRVLVAGGQDNNSNPLSTVELYDPISGVWTPTGDLNVARGWHTATLLTNGMVLVAGGHGDSGDSLASAELYDPISATWSVTTNSMHFGRDVHSATLLPDGRVLVAGGFGSNGVALASAETFNPQTGTWILAFSLNKARGAHTATLLPNGMVLATGGYGTAMYEGSLSSIELYDPAAGFWTITNALTFARGNQTATMLPNDNVVVAGGFGSSGCVASTELGLYGPPYNPYVSQWTTNGSLNTARSGQTATLLPSGKVLVAGGLDVFPNTLASAELYDSANGTWTNTGSLNTARRDHTATLLPNGKVLVAGGLNTGFLELSNAELYDPASGTWTNTGSMNNARSEHTATLLFNGKVLVLGSLNWLDISAELYDPATGTWQFTGSLNPTHLGPNGQTATLLPNGKVLVAAGYEGQGVTSNADLYDPASGTWTDTGPLNFRRSGHTATLLPNGKVLVSGGYVFGGPATNAELYDPVSGTWTNTGSMNYARAGHTATLLPCGKVLVAGGYTQGPYSYFATELYDPARGAWTGAGLVLGGITGHTATLLPSGKVLIAGGGDILSSFVTGVAELYDVGLGFTNSWQPQIAAITSPLTEGGCLTLTGSQFRGISEGSSGNSQDSSADYPLVQLRSLANEQTLFVLSTNWSDTSFSSTPVIGFPDGYALVTVFVNGIPSTSRILYVGPIVLANPTKPLGGAYQFTFANTPGLSFTALGTTNLSQSLSDWTVLGGATEISPGQFQFTDPQAADSPQRFYLIRSP